MKSFSIHLLLRHATGPVLPRRNVQIWLEKAGQDQHLGEALTDADGACTVTFSLPESEFKKIPPFCYVLVYERGRLVYGEKDKPQYKLAEAEMTIRLTLQHELRPSRVEQIPVRSEQINLSAAELSKLTEAQQKFVTQRLDTTLVAELRRYLGEVDKDLSNALPNLNLDHRTWLDKTLGDVLQTAVLPILLADPAMRKLLETRRLTENLVRNTRPVREVLHLDQPIRRNPLFQSEIRTLNVSAVVQAARLPDELTELLLDQPGDWTRAADLQWQKLVDDGVLSAEHKTTLQRAFAISRFTGGQSELAGVLLEKHNDLRELAAYDEADWLDLIKQTDGTTPDGASQETYAANLVRLAQRNFPSAFFLERKVKRGLPQQDQLLAELQTIQSPGSAKRGSRGADTPPSGSRLPLENTPALRAAANTYRHLGFEDLLSDPATNPEAKIEAMATRQGYLKKFVQNNPTLDLRSADFFAKGDSGERVLSYTGIPSAQRDAVRHQMMAFQRVNRLTRSFEAQDTLLAAGFDSSYAIATERAEDIRSALEQHLSTEEIQGVYTAAQTQFGQVVHATAALQSISSTEYLGLQVLQYDPNIVNQLKDIDGYAEMFGSQDYCECEHCKSIFGPAAYFVDLMSFIEKNVELMRVEQGTIGGLANPHNHPIWLRSRRPDLWNLELTCENTNRPVSYLSLVNEIKQSYLLKALGWGNPGEFEKIWQQFSRLLPTGGNSGGGGQDSVLNALPADGTTWKYSFRLAFNRPYEESMILLEYFGFRYIDLLHALGVAAADDRWEQSYLNTSAEEWAVLTTPDGYVDDLRVMRFGFPATDDTSFNLSKVEIRRFMRATGLTFTEVEVLLSLKSLRDVGAVTLLREVDSSDDIQNYIESVQGLDHAAVLDFLHRFLRLQRRLGWSLRELDAALQQTGGLGSVNGLSGVAQIEEIRRVLELPFEEALALYKTIPNLQLYTRQVTDEFLGISVDEPVAGMLDRLFDPEKLPLDGSVTLHRATLSGDPHLPYLLKGLRTTEADFTLAYDALFGTADLPLKPEEVSRCYRLIRLAKLLGWSVEDFIYLLKMNGIGVQLAPAGILQLVRTAEDFRALPVSVQQAWWLVKAQDTSLVRFKYTGDPERATAAETAAMTLMSGFVADERLFLSLFELLRATLPSEATDAGVDLYLQNLITQGWVTLLPSGQYLVTTANTLSSSDLLDSITVIIDGGPVTITVEDSRQQAIADALNTHNRKAQETVFQEHLAQLFLTAPDLVAAMPAWLSNYAAVWNEAQGNIGAATLQYSALKTALPEFERAVMLFAKNGLDMADLAFLNANIGLVLDHPAPSSGFLSAFNRLAELQRLATYARFKAQFADDTAGLAAFQTMLHSAQSTWVTNYPAALAKSLGFEPGQVSAISLSLPAATQADQYLETLAAMERTLGVFGTLGIYDKPVLDAFKENRYEKALIYEAALRSAFRARFATEAEYEKAWEPWGNRMEELRRDVLCAFLIAISKESGFKDTGDLYAYFLVDVEMSGCATVSRILAAILTCQLYVHRVIMGLEMSAPIPSTTADDDPFPSIRAFLGHPALNNQDVDTRANIRKQWDWRKNYRVWEANRKVFLYPENWIEPELRDDKTPLFRTLEDELLQQKITLESAEGAYKMYLKGLSEVGSLVIAGSYYFTEDGYPCYYLFGRTQADPYRYFYRKMKILDGDRTEWTAWEQVDLAIACPFVSPFVRNNVLHLFWMETATMERNSINGGTSTTDKYFHDFTACYSYLNPAGKWIAPQKLKGMTNEFEGFFKPDKKYLYGFLSNAVRQRLFPELHDDSLFLGYTFDLGDDLAGFADNASRNFILDFYQNSLSVKYGIGGPGNVFTPDLYRIPNTLHPELSTAYLAPTERVYRGADLENAIQVNSYDKVTPYYHFAKLPSAADRDSELRVVQNSWRNHLSDAVLRVFNQQALIFNDSVYPDYWRFKLFPLSTSITETLISHLFNTDLPTFLSVATQYAFPEKPMPLTEILVYGLIVEIRPNDRIDFSGSHGLYFRELFFHIPFLIADHLNAEGKYEEADKWYRYIFDPSADFEANPQFPTDYYWQYLGFREQTLLRLKEILSDPATISAYQNDPFNPHIIARLRTGPYQKAVVMKYVDNLIDWGDSLFRGYTWENNTKALMLYQLAKDILGERPQRLGSCDSAIGTENCGCDHPVTYAALQATAGGKVSDFVYYVDNWVTNLSSADDQTGHGTISHGTGLGDVEVLTGYESFESQATAQGASTVQNRESGGPSTGIQPANSNWMTAVSLGSQLYRREGQNLVFCIPPNEKLFEYYDRVDDRLFKLRHCLDINGTKRSLALYEAPIDPALLVAAAAAGLSLDDILGGLYADLPPYRFMYLIEKAKAFAGTVQGFGGALLSALEKKDVEQLTLLRSTQEQNILKMTKEVKKKAIEEARANLQGAVEGMVNVMNRVTQYTLWIDENLNGWEKTQQIALHTSSTLSAIEPIYNTIASIVALIPNAGAPTAMTFGGKELKGAAENGARIISSLAHVASLLSSSAGLEASFQRRAKDWEFQKKSAELELKQVQQQIAAAAVRLSMAEKDLEIHEKQIEQAEELHQFYKDKFTGLGLYNYLATTLSRVHRQAFNVAMDLARQAEQAYKFETNDDTYFGLSGGIFWDASRGGLLAGEQISLELLKLESAYIGNHRRRLEIRQSFSLRLLDPVALLALRKDGVCSFRIPEWAFDIQYPGQYRRRLVSAQITIPCVSGPYGNIGATLTLLKGSLKKGELPGSKTEVFNFRGCSMVATSSANNDGGQFDLNFHDERYLPFEGAGAVDSEWNLELPGTYRTFDYNTISDVIVHLSYQAIGGGSKPSAVQIKNAAGTLNRLISLKEEFPEAWYQLGLNQPATITLSKKHFPFFAQASVVEITAVSALDSSSANAPIITNSWQITILPTHKNTAGDDVWLLIPYTLPTV